MKSALQDLCKLYRQGFRIHPAMRYGVVTTITGLIHTSVDSKVRRWALNTLAHIGLEKECKSAISFALNAYGDDEEIVAAGIAALCKLVPSPENELRRLQFPGQVVCLAALQHISADKLDLSALPVDVETAKPDIIKTALVVVGLNRAPPHMFDPDYSNAAIVQAVGKHDDPVVVQYSVWAITENDVLGVRDLGIDLKQIESHRSNVRSWVYRLLAMDAEAGGKYKDYIVLGCRDESAEARAGLALGLKDTFHDSLARIVLDWFSTETNPDVRQNLADHLIVQAGKSPIYWDHAIEVYEHEPPGSVARERMLATASRSGLFPVFKRIDAQTGDLFNGGIIMSQTNNLNFGNNAQIGSVAVGGDAANSGALCYSAQTTELLKARLNEAETCISELPIPDAEKRVATQSVSDAKGDPNTGTIGRVVSALRNAASLVTAAGGGAESLNQIIHGINTLAGN